MRVSALKEDRGYAEWETGKWLGTHVFVDGVEVRDVFTFDTEEGLVVRAKLNGQGNIYAELGTNQIAVEEVRGVVTYEQRA